MAVRATERLHSQNPLLRDGRLCSKIDLNPPGVKGGSKKWHQPTANPYFAAFCDPVLGDTDFFGHAAKAHLLREGSPLKRLLSRVDTDAEFLRVPPIAEKMWGSRSFPNHPSEAISLYLSTLLTYEAVILNFIRLGVVCDEELFLRMADFRLAASPNTGQAVILIMLESLIAELLEQWPAAAAAGGNNAGTTTIKGLLAAPVTHSPITATDVYDSFLMVRMEGKFSEVCPPRRFSTRASRRGASASLTQ